MESHQFLDSMESRVVMRKGIEEGGVIQPQGMGRNCKNEAAEVLAA